MTISTKHELDDTLYYILDGMVWSGKVSGFKINLLGGGPTMSSCIFQIFTGHPEGGYTDVPEERCFPTKKALLASL